MTESTNTPRTMNNNEIIMNAENDYAGFVSKVKNGEITVDAVSDVFLSIDNRFANLDVEVRTGTIDYLWMGFTLRGEEDFSAIVLPIAEFAEGLIEGALRQSPSAGGNNFEFEVEVGQVMEPETITETFTFYYRDDLGYWEIKSNIGDLSYVGEKNGTVYDLVNEIYGTFDAVNDKYDYLVEQQRQQG